MTRFLFAILLAAALALVVTCLLSLDGAGDAASRPATDAISPDPLGPPEPPAAPDPERRASPALEATRREVAENAPAVLRDEDPTARLEVAVFRPDGSPCEGARVVVSEAPDRGYSFLDSGFGSPRATLGDARTDAAGLASFDLRTGRSFELAVSAEGFAACLRRAVRAGTRVRVDLAHHASVTGRVFDAVSGEPLGDALVELRPGRAALVPWNGRPDEFTTGIDGWFRFEGVAPGAIEITASHPRFSMGWPTEFELRPGERIVHDLRLDPGDTVNGIVRDAITAAPIEGATIWIRFGPVGAGEVKTDDSGKFSFPDFPRHAYDLTARAPGYAAQQTAVRTKRGEEPAGTVEFALVPERRARGSVVDASGAPLAGVYVAAAATDFRGENDRQRIDWNSTLTDKGGTFEITGIHPDLEPVLVLRRDGFATTLYDFPKSPDPIVEFGAITLGIGATVEVEVVDEHGRPRDDLRIELVGANSDRARFATDRVVNPLLDSYVATRVARPLDGIALFRDVAAGDHELRTMIPGTHGGSDHRFTVKPEERRKRVRVVVPRGLEMRGRIRAGDDGTVPKVYVSIDPCDGQGTSGDAECDAAGRFRATGLAPGRYRLTVYPYAREEDIRIGRGFESVTKENVILGLEEIEIVLPVKDSRSR